MGYKPTPVLVERIENAILFIRGHKVMLDHDLANLYEVSTKALNQPRTTDSKAAIGQRIESGSRIFGSSGIQGSREF